MRKKIIIICSFVFFCTNSYAQLAGDLDSTFSFDGYNTTYFNPNGSFTDVVIQTDGKIIGTGHNSNNEMVTVRYNSDGTIDNTFGTAGIVTKAFGGYWPRFNELQSDGKILIAGAEFSSYVYYSALRYNSNGTIDSTFDSDGQALIFPGLVNNTVGDMKVQSDGKILIAGTCDNGTSYHDMAILRLNVDGSIDSTFSGDGFAKKSAMGHYPTINTMAVQADGKIVIAGTIETGGLHKYVVLRFNVNGVIDSTFDGDGISYVGTLPDNYIRSIALQTDGKIVAIGDMQMPGGKDFFLARFKSNGSLDSLFGVNGFLTTDFTTTNDFAYDVCIQADNKIVAVGYTVSSTSFYHAALARYDASGTLDINFGSYGKVTNLLGQFTTVYSCELQTNGRIIVVGSQVPLINNNQYFLVSRYLAESTVGINQLNKQEAIRIYPNPFESNIVIEMDDSMNGGTVSVLDACGRLMFSELYEKEIKLDLSTAQSGLYFIQVVSKEGEVYVSKVVKK